MNRDLVKQLTDIWLGKEIDNNGIFIKAAKRIEALEKALETYAEDCDMTCCETIHRQGQGCGYVARAALEEEYDK